MRSTQHISAKRQQGSTLLVAIVLLLLASLMGLMAMNVGMFEQRSSGNDMRAKIVHQAAEAGLAQGFEYLMRANSTMIDNTANWELCGASDTTFPCGAVPSSVRGNMYRLKAGVGGFTDASGTLATALTQYMLKVPNSLTAMGSFDVAYGVAPVLCRVPLPVSNTSISCATDMSNLSDRRVVTFVSVAQVKNDSGRTTLTQTVARSSLLAQPGGVPTIIASGTVVPPGNGDVVAMPDAAGPGLDVAVWSRLNVEPASGSFATCTRQDFLASGQVSLTDASWISSRTCDKCGCGMAKKSGTYTEGWDILDADSNASGGINKDVVASEFPCDLFEYAFNVKAWKDTDGDNFCEARMPRVTTFVMPRSGGKTCTELGVQCPYPEEAFLYTNATKIIYSDANASYVRDEQKSKATLTSADSGLIWCQIDCLPNNGQVGTATAPVAVVADPATNTPYHAKLFGLLFYRANGDGPLDATTGGNAGMKFNAQSAVYGSVVIQGQVQTGSGGGLLYGDAEVLKALSGLDPMQQFDTLRGGWTDGYSY